MSLTDREGSIGDSIISSAIWYQYARVNFSKTTKLHEPEGRVKFVVFEEVTSAYYTKFLEKSCYYLLIMYMNQHHRKSRERQTKFWKRARAIFNLHLCYNFALLFSDQWECTGFQQIRSVHVIFSCTLLQMFQNQDRCRKGNWCFQINIEIVLYRAQLLQKVSRGCTW